MKSQAQYDIDETDDRTAQINDGALNRNPKDIGFWPLVAEDFRTHDKMFFAQGFWALFWHRFGNWRMGIRLRPARLPMTLVYKCGIKLTQWLCGIDLPYTVCVGRRVKLEHFGGMILIARAIGDDVFIRQNTTFGLINRQKNDARPTIGDGVDIGAGVAVLGDITVGTGSVIAANAVVTRDCPPHAVMAGLPARAIKVRGERKRALETTA